MSLLNDALNKYNTISGTTKARIGAAGGIVALGGIATALYKRRKTKSRSKTTYRTSKNRNKSRKTKTTVRRKQKQPYTARKRKDTSRRRIRYTKNNQPYIILASGKARFIKKKSVKISRKRSGGKY